MEENLYQQKSVDRAIGEFGCIKKRLEALPEALLQKIVGADVKEIFLRNNMEKYLYALTGEK